MPAIQQEGHQIAALVAAAGSACFPEVFRRSARVSPFLEASGSADENVRCYVYNDIHVASD
jgi:hypothetical protein